MEIKAKMSALEFYSQQSELREGAYEVVEHDGEINIAVVRARNLVKWYDQAEWEEAQADLARELELDFRLDSIMAFEPDDDLDDVDPSHYNDCNGCGTCHLCDDHLSTAGDYTARNDGMGDDCSARNLDETPLKNKYPEPVKTLGELLRESMSMDKVNAEHQQMNSPAFNSIHGSMGTRGDV